jgi:hypothetical protein
MASEESRLREALQDLADLKAQVGELPGMDEAIRLLQQVLTTTRPGLFEEGNP